MQNSMVMGALHIKEYNSIVFKYVKQSESVVVHKHDHSNVDMWQTAMQNLLAIFQHRHTS